MAIEIHIRVRETDWDIENEIAYNIANQIEDIIPGTLNIPILVLPVDDPGNEMEELI